MCISLRRPQVKGEDYEAPTVYQSDKNQYDAQRRRAMGTSPQLASLLFCSSATYTVDSRRCSHRRLSGLFDQRFDMIDVGRCRNVYQQQYCNLQERVSCGSCPVFVHEMPASLPFFNPRCVVDPLLVALWLTLILLSAIIHV